MALEVTPEFISDGIKKGGPYSKADRIKRQTEVYRLHFELSYSASKIAEMMKINLKTIYEDIKILNKRLGVEWTRLGHEPFLMKQVNRLELQRQRLVERMESAKELSDIMPIEKMVYELDCKLIAIMTKVGWSDDKLKENTIFQLNAYAKKYETGTRWIDQNAICCCSDETYKKIERLMEKDSKKEFFP